MLSFGGKKISDAWLAYTAEVDSFTGASALRVPVPVPPGRDGLAPDLALAYFSSAGNSILGAGWSLTGLPAISLDTRFHVPRWDGSDGYQFGNDELVPWLSKSGGTWAPRGFHDSHWSVAFLRSRRGGSNMRVEKWVHTATGRVHFRTRDARNLVTVYGARPNAAARLADPADETRTLAWLPELQIDVRGNALYIEYLAETVDGINRVASFERSNPALSQRYVKRIKYGNAAPLSLSESLESGQLPQGTHWHFQLVLDYGDHSDANQPGVNPNRPWLSRKDPFSIFCNGFEIRTHRLCRRFLAFHDFPELGASPSLVDAVVLEHKEEPAGSILTKITRIGFRVDGGVSTSMAMPPLTMTYAPTAIDTSFSELPARSRENVPAGLATSRYTFVDLFGEGLAGILTESDRNWFYKPNLGDGEFGAQTAVLERPATTPGAFTFANLESNGNTGLAQLGGRSAGFYELNRENATWSSFRPFAAFPHVEGLTADARWVDLNGDRRPDVVITKAEHFTWFPSDGDTFSVPVDIPRPDGPDGIPTLTDDPALDFVFADMTGDGLADLVRVQNGRIWYWPSLGNGYFGDAIVMQDVPQFAAEAEFDSSRLRFADIDGSGTTDLIYLGHGQVSCWINASGNRLLPGPVLDGLPYFDNISNVRVLDFLGDGRPCVVWSSPLPGRENALEYLRLAPVERPRLLLSVNDSRGRETRFTYSSSSLHYLRDVRSGRGWETRLPGHRPVVAERQVIDGIGNTRSVQRFEYHDGYYDGDEHQLRGFGHVDVYDSAAVGHTPPGPAAAPPAPPALSRAWFHLGNAMWSTAREDQYYAGDPSLPVLSPHAINDSLQLSADDIDDGLRALAGRLIRRETYSIDDAGTVAANPIEVEQVCYRLRELQPRNGSERPAFSSVILDNATWTYEQVAGDPRVSHAIVVDTDDYDAPTRQAVIAYARRGSGPTDLAAQKRYFIQVRDHLRINIDDVDRYELGIQAESKSYEVTGIRPLYSLFFRDHFLDPNVVSALASPGRHDLDPPDDPQQGPRARILSWEQTFYWDDVRLNPLPVGHVGSTTLLHHEEAACFETTFVTNVFGSRVNDPKLTTLGYSRRDGFWWQSDETHTYAPRAAFSQQISLTRGDGATTQFVYDAHSLAMKIAVDAMGNATTAEIDYQQLAPWRITDANGNVAEVRYDALGVIVASTSYGHVDTQKWGFDSLAQVVARSPASVADAITNAATFIQGAMRYVWYDLDAWSKRGIPTTAVNLSREALVHDGVGGGVGGGRLQVLISYLDGVGRILQEKHLVETGPAIQRDGSNKVIVDGQGQPILVNADVRWRASGHVIYDAKQRPVRQFEPFFTGSPAYEADDVLQRFGTSTLTRYDVLGRAVGQEFANGTFSRITFKPWSVEESDADDNVLNSLYATTRQGLPSTDPERQAYEEAKHHAATPRVGFLDPLGREAGHLAQGGITAADRRTDVHLDILGRETEIVDSRGLVAFANTYDMQGRVVRQLSVDAGETWHLGDGYGRDINTWDGRGFAIERGYDKLDRHLFTHVKDGDGAVPLDHVVEQHIYGETLADRNDAIKRNLLGHVAITRDGAQEMTVKQCDPTGRVMVAARQLRADVDTEPDWRGAVPLEGDTFTTSAVFDGLGRCVADTLVDQTVRIFEYLQGGALSRVLVTTPDGTMTSAPVMSRATVNARGQRLTETFGNGVDLEYVYDPQTYRLTSQSATRGTRVFQQINYTYDPVGNIVRLTDAAQDTGGGLITGLSVPARRDYLYDAHYRLIQASGRVHQALLQNDYVPGTPGTFKGTQHITFNNGAAIERFTRSYDYDASSNLLHTKHVGTSHSWTTTMWVSATSNRSTLAIDLNGNPISSPESQFDASGNLKVLSHLRQLVWNWRNELARGVVIQRPNATDDAERYVYAADGLRARKVTTRVVQGGVVETTENVYFDDVERKRITRGGTTILERWTVHIADEEQRIALIYRWTVDSNGREVDDISKSRIHYLLNTHQASVAIELDKSGALISYEEYFPFGGSSFIAGDNLKELDWKAYRYGGKEYDAMTGLYYYGYRYYAPWLSRWLSPDMSGPVDDLNLYEFVLSDPVRNVDPDGSDSKPGEVVYTDRAPVAVEDTASDDRLVGATRASLAPELQPLFDSLSSADKLRFAKGSNLALIPRDLDNLGAGGKLVTRHQFFQKYLRMQVAWAKRHGVKVGIERERTPSAVVNPASKDGGAGESDAGDGPPDAAEKGSGSGTGDLGSGGSDKKAGIDGTGSANDAGDGTGAVGGKNDTAVGTGDGVGTGATGDGKGTGTGTVTGPGAGNGTDSGKGADAGTGTKVVVPGATKGPGGGGGKRHGSGAGSEDGGPGGGPGGVLGGTPFSTGHDLDALGSPLTHGPPSDDGSQKQGDSVTGGTRQGIGGDPAGKSNKNRGAGAGNGGAARTGRERGTPTGSGGPPGSNRQGSLTGTVAAQPHPGAGANGHGSGGGQGPDGISGTKAEILKIAGYLNLEFGEGDANGSSGGIPGGQGSHKGNSFWQAAYVLVTIVNTIMMVKSIVQSIAKGALARIWRLISSPRVLIRDFVAFLGEGAQAWKKFFGRGGGVGPGKRFATILKALFYDVRNWGTIRKFRNADSFLFKPRLFGTLERIGNRSLYTWEHIFPQSIGRSYPRLRPFINSYLNSGLRLPMEFNSALGNRLGPKLSFYYGAGQALVKSWQFGTWFGHKAIDDRTSATPVPNGN
jgi:RHS repeat-associated protein